MDKLTKLRQKRSAKVKQMREINDLANTEERELSKEEEEKYAGLRADVKNIDAEIEREEELRSLEDVSDEPEVPDVRVTKDREDKKGKPGEFKHFGEQLEAVVRAAHPNHGVVDERLTTRAASGLSTQIDADGGFLVQSDFASGILQKAIDASVLASRVRRVGVGPNSNGLKMNALKDSDRSDGNRAGGVTTYWEDEADLFTASKPSFTQMEWKLKKLIGACYATEESLQDAGALGQVIQQVFADEFAYKLDDAIFAGTGSGQPLGILNAPCVVEVAKESGQAADSVVGMNVIKMRARLWARSRANSVWLYNQDVEPTLHKLNIKGDASLSDFMIWQPANGIAGEPFDRLYGRPAIPIEQAKTVGDVGDFVLADLSQYLLIDKGGLNSDVSIHVRFLYDERTFKFVLRVDGQPMWPTTLTPANGSNTQAPFVTLAARA